MDDVSRPASLFPKAIHTRWANAALLLLGGILMLLFWKGAHDQNTQRLRTFLAGAFGAGIPFCLAAWVVWRARPARSTFLLVLVLGMGFRIAPLTSDAYLSTDLYRYIWDGRVQAAGINPYRYAPGDIRLVHLRDGPIYTHINRRNYAKTVYPPGSEMVFLLLTRVSETVTCVRLTMILFEALAVWCLILLLRDYGQPAQRILLYAWHPLVVWEFAGGGHCDAIMLAAVALALLMHRRGRPFATGMTLGAAVLAKLFPIILFPALYRRWRWDWRMPLACLATVCGGYLPYTVTYTIPGALGFLPMYTEEEGLTTGDRFYFLNMLPSGFFNAHGIPTYKVFILLAGSAFAAAAAWAYWKRQTDDLSTLRRCAFVATLFVAVLSPAVDWYWTWTVLFLPFLPECWLIWVTLSSFTLYFNWLYLDPDDIYWQNSVIFLPAILLYAVPAALRRYRAWKQPPEFQSAARL